MNNAILGPGVSHSLAYRADIDGLRGIAVLLVVLFHLDLKPFAGGFVGVDVFFVLSGYLITSILLADLDRGRFSLKRFSLRRIRRIIPALAAMAFVCLLVAGRLFGPRFFSEFAWSLRALVTFVSNIHFARMGTGGGYFDPPPIPQPLLHTWSIAVEEQFYVFFPVTLLLLTRCVRRFRAVVLAAILAASLAFSIWATRHHPLDAFYLLPARIWEFLLGALLTLKLVPPATNRLLREIAACAGLAGILYAAFTYTSATPFPGYTALLPCLGAALLIYAGDAHERPALVTSLLTSTPLVFVGVISYSLYLWHWPIIVFTRYVLDTPSYLGFTPLQLMLLAAAALVAALLSYRLVELPFRTRDSRIQTPRLLLIGAGSMVLLAALAFAVTHTSGLPQRFNTPTRASIEANEAAMADTPFDGSCDNVTGNPKRFQDAVFCGTGQTGHNILFWGDSQTAQLQSTLVEMKHEGAWPGKGIVFATYGGCPPTEHMNMRPGTQHCDLFASFAMQRALAPDIDTVWIQFLPWWIYGRLCESDHGHCGRPLRQDEIVARLLQELTSHIETLKRAGKHVILCLQFPSYLDSVPRFLIRNAVLGSLSPTPEPQSTGDVLYEQDLAIARQEGIEFFDPRKSLCPAERCTFEQNGVSIYCDAQHLRRSRVGMLKPNLLATIH